MEIERKFLVDEPPPDADEGELIDQGYLAIDGAVEVRVRRRATKATLTVKGGSGRSRVESETAIPAAEFDALWPLTEGRRVRKRRALVPLDGGLTAELDRYLDALEGLVVVEVEFDSEATADTFDPPPWFGRELTDDGRYANRALATDGRPA